MSLNTLIKILGKPKEVNIYSKQIEFNCPVCKEQNSGIADNKYNLVVKFNAVSGNNRKPKNVFKCWKCPSFKGDLKFLIKKYGSRNDVSEYEEYVKNFTYVEETEKIVYRVRLPKEFINFKNIDNDNPRHVEALKYLTETRNLELELIHKYELGFCIEGRFENRVVFPSYDKNNKLNYFTARAFVKNQQKYDNPAIDRTSIIFNEKHINWNSTVYLVEGAFEEYAMNNNAVPLLGKVLYPLLLEKLLKYKPNVIIALNGDAFRNIVEDLTKPSSTIEIGKVLKNNGLTNVKYLELPENDFGDILENRGREGVNEVIKNNVKDFNF